jgi:tetratricopeptide (TPR) repeat protein
MWELPAPIAPGPRIPWQKAAQTLLAGMTLMLALIGPAASVRADEPDLEGHRALAAKVEQLITDLGADQFARRENAQAALKQLGLIAFDALIDAQRHPDIEVALRARYLVRSLPIRWARDTDPRRVKGFLATYATQNRADRLNRMQQLAALSNSSGIEALCRLVRFETDHLLSKEAALLAINHVVSEDATFRKELADRIRATIELSNRTGAGWMLTYAQTLVSAEDTVDQWQRIVDAEFDNLARFPESTDRDIVRDLLRWQAVLLRQMGRRDGSLSVIRRTLNLMEGDREEIFDFVDWSLEFEAWNMIEEIARQFPIEFNKEADLVYRLAEARRKRGEEPLAQETAARALAMQTKLLERHTVTALTLRNRLMYDWSENEFRLVINNRETENRITLDSRFLLGDMLFDLKRVKEAAEVVQGAVDAVDKDPRLLQQLQQSGRSTAVMRGTAAYYQAMHFGSIGDSAQQIEFLDKAIALQPTQPDYLIAMFRVEEADEAWREATLKRIQIATERLRDNIRIAEQTRNFDKSDNDALVAVQLNELAWLISNTVGDYREALRCSRKSLELAPGSGANLDTLGRCYYAVGDLENAVMTQEMAVEESPYYQQIHRQLKFFKEELAKQKAGQESSQSGESAVDPAG